MGLHMDLKTPSNAEIILQKLRESNSIDLYQDKKQVDDTPEFLKQARNFYAVQEAKQQTQKMFNLFKEETRDDILATTLYYAVLNPVLEHFACRSREKELGMNLVDDFIKEHDTESLLDRFRYKNIYLAEMAFEVDKECDKIFTEARNRIKEGLSEDDIYNIEEGEVKNYILNAKNIIPKDVSKIITRRVQSSIDDFIDSKKKSQADIQRIYDKAKERLATYQQNDMMDPMQTDAPMSDGGDPDAAIDGNMGAKMDAQQDQNIVSGQKPTQISPMTMTPKQEAMAYARSREHTVLESSYNVLDGMMRSLVESIYKIDILKEAYSTNGKINIEKAFDDTKVMYCWLECVNTLCIEDIDSNYISSMLKEMSNVNGVAPSASFGRGDVQNTTAQPSKLDTTPVVKNVGSSKPNMTNNSSNQMSSNAM